MTDRRDAQWAGYRRAPNLILKVIALVDAALAGKHYLGHVHRDEAPKVPDARQVVRGHSEQRVG